MVTNRLYYQDKNRLIYNADCRSMTDLEDESVQCVVTSPPYWGLRKYSGEQDLIWGGDKDCVHEWGEVEQVGRYDKKMAADYGGWERGGRNNDARTQNSSSFCQLCGAWRGSYGLEPTPEMYVEHTIEILREIRRVLRKDGVVFWNIGDSYASQPSGSRKPSDLSYFENIAEGDNGRPNKITGNLKPKDLCLIPFRVAIAAQEDGWWVRSVIIWNKPNPMPESVKDRPTEAHEYILMLTKSGRYYWDQEAVRECKAESTVSDTRNNGNGHRRERGYPGYQSNGGTNLGGPEGGRNLRSVWTFPTQPYPEAHFAIFPEKLPELCIKASTPEYGCCSKCGKPYERVTERVEGDNQEWAQINNPTRKAVALRGEKSVSTSKLNRGSKEDYYQNSAKQYTTGWQPGCKCNADITQSIVLDPFAGAGTTLKVAAELNRKAIGYELSEEYCQLIIERNRQQILI